ncbi:hypothetical protein TNCV_3163951 [Trichonephila clavipes]|nr:hypothetical protein TNCV_3163951 [Trichonephila clavipes]
MPPRCCPIETSEILLGKELVAYLSLAIVLSTIHTGDRSIWLSSTLTLRENPLGYSGAFYFSFLSTTLMRGLEDRHLFRVHTCRKDITNTRAFSRIQT